MVFDDFLVVEIVDSPAWRGYSREIGEVVVDDLLIDLFLYLLILFQIMIDQSLLDIESIGMIECILRLG